MFLLSQPAEQSLDDRCIVSSSQLSDSLGNRSGICTLGQRWSVIEATCHIDLGILWQRTHRRDLLVEIIATKSFELIIPGQVHATSHQAKTALTSNRTGKRVGLPAAKGWLRSPNLPGHGPS